MSGAGPRTETPLPTSICCSSWRAKPQHGDCPGRVRPGNLGPLLPCSCECHTVADRALAAIRPEAYA